MHKKLFFYFSICLLSSFYTSAQKKVAGIPSSYYPQDYFRNPLDIPIFLAGNFGECRPGHFHSGIDIKTKGEENQPVHAAADGYVSRIKMEKGGFGHGLYITHPNGYTTLYAHLNDFAPEIQKYVRRQQYAKEQWNVDLQLTPSQFPVKKGQLVAYSGNTGASTAPHLHFEIRNTKTEHPLNPEQFGLPIVDNVAPVPTEVAFYSVAPFSYTNFATMALQKRGDSYKPFTCTGSATCNLTKDTIYTGERYWGIAIRADDYMNGSDNSLTFYTAKLLVDDTLQAEITLDDIGYDETRYINAYTDYSAKKQKGKWLQRMFLLPGNKLERVYTTLNAQKGILDMGINTLHKIDIIITDDKGNESKVSFYHKSPLYTAATDYDYNKKPTIFKVNQVNKFNEPNVMFSLDERQLYDNMLFNFSKKEVMGIYSDKYDIGAPDIPIHHYFDLMIKPTKPVPFDLRNKMALKYTDGKDEEGSAAMPIDDGWYKTSVRAFGTYWLDIDTIPPVIKPFQKQGANMGKAKQVLLDVKDAQTSVKKFNGYIDDKWVCFEQHGSSFFYKFDEHCPKGKHTLLFKAEDENGNTATYNLTFTR